MYKKIYVQKICTKDKYEDEPTIDHVPPSMYVNREKDAAATSGVVAISLDASK